MYTHIWGSLTMPFTSKFVYIAHHFIYGSIPLTLGTDRDKWWFEHSVS